MVGLVKSGEDVAFEDAMARAKDVGVPEEKYAFAHVASFLFQGDTAGAAGCCRAGTARPPRTPGTSSWRARRSSAPATRGRAIATRRRRSSIRTSSSRRWGSRGSPAIAGDAARGDEAREGAARRSSPTAPSRWRSWRSRGGAIRCAKTRPRRRRSTSCARAPTSCPPGSSSCRTRWRRCRARQARRRRRARGDPERASRSPTRPAPPCGSGRSRCPSATRRSRARRRSARCSSPRRTSRRAPSRRGWRSSAADSTRRSRRPRTWSRRRPTSPWSARRRPTSASMPTASRAGSRRCSAETRKLPFVAALAHGARRPLRARPARRGEAARRSPTTTTRRGATSSRWTWRSTPATSPTADKIAAAWGKEAESQPLRALRLARLARYEGRLDAADALSQAALDAATVTPRVLWERAYTLVARGRVAEVAPLLARYPLVLGPLATWLSAYATRLERRRRGRQGQDRVDRSAALERHARSPGRGRGGVRRDEGPATRRRLRAGSARDRQPAP